MPFMSTAPLRKTWIIKWGLTLFDDNCFEGQRIDFDLGMHLGLFQICGWPRGWLGYVGMVWLQLCMSIIVGCHWCFELFWGRTLCTNHQKICWKIWHHAWLLIDMSYIFFNQPYPLAEVCYCWFSRQEFGNPRDFEHEIILKENLLNIFQKKILFLIQQCIICPKMMRSYPPGN